MPKHEYETYFTEQLGKDRQSGDDTWPGYVTLQNKICYQKVV